MRLLTTMALEQCFERGSVVSELQATNKIEALRELIRRAPVFRKIPSIPAFEEAVIAREKVSTTGFGHGIAVAHGRIPGLESVLIGFGISRAGIQYESVDGKPVHLLFVIASPPHLALDYLQVLSTLVRCLRDKPVRESILACLDAQEMEDRIREAFMLDLGKQSIEAAG